MPKHMPTVIWCLRKPGTYPNGYLATLPGGGFEFVRCQSEDDCLAVMHMPRSDWRLLAKRINEALESTK